MTTLQVTAYDTYTISDSEMEAIADDLADDYVHQLYWSSLKIIIKDRYSHIPKKGTRKVILLEHHSTSSNEKSAASAIQVALYDVSEIVSTDKQSMVWEESGEDLKKWLSLQVPIEVVSAPSARKAFDNARSICTTNQWIDCTHTSHNLE